MQLMCQRNWGWLLTKVKVKELWDLFVNAYVIKGEQIWKTMVFYKYWPNIIFRTLVLMQNHLTFPFTVCLFSADVQYMYLISNMVRIIKSPRVTGGPVLFWSVSAAVSAGTAVLPTFSTFWENPWSWFLQNTHGWPMGVGKNFGTHLGDLGSRSLSYWSGTQFT